MLVGGFFAWGRAEALLFFAFRPWLLLAAALLIARWDWRSRALFYALALGAAGLGESLLILSLGGDPWHELLRGWAAGAMLAFFFDLLVQLGLKLRGRIGQAVAGVAGMLVLVVPGALRPYEIVALGPTEARAQPHKPRLLLMTGLPIIWGELGPFDPHSRPAAAYRALGDEFELRPLDYLDQGSLAAGRLMLLAQPRALEPTELVALDAWVRGGGRLLVLTDPSLVWPSRLPALDVRRPPPTGYLTPLLRHWGLDLVAPSRPALTVEAVHDGQHLRRLALAAPGRFVASGEACRVGWRGLLARCRIGAGAALLLADADLLHDALWTAPIGRGGERHARLADNPLIVAGLLDRLQGVERERAARPVQWRSPAADPTRATLLALLPTLLLAGAAVLRGRARRT